MQVASLPSTHAETPATQHCMPSHIWSAPVQAVAVPIVQIVRLTPPPPQSGSHGQLVSQPFVTSHAHALT